MKDFLLLIVGGAVLVALFADGGGLELSPTISPALDAQLNVSYAPDRSVTTIENQTTIDTNIERQTVIYQAAPVGTGAGVTLVDAGPGRCATQPGDVVESEQGNGACFVANNGQRFFVNPNGNRWPVDNGAAVDAAGGGLQPLATPSTSSGQAAAAPLSPPGELTIDQLQAAFLRNGGRLPWFWNMRSADDKRTWLMGRGETWR